LQGSIRHHPLRFGDRTSLVAALARAATPASATATTATFIRDLRDRVLGSPEISTDGYTPYLTAIRDAFGNRVAHGVVTKTYSVTHLTVTEASRRYSPAAAVAVSRDVVSGVPAEISTSYVERQNLSVRMSSRRFRDAPHDPLVTVVSPEPRRFPLRSGLTLLSPKKAPLGGGASSFRTRDCGEEGPTCPNLQMRVS
jgi:hypothetical protein